MDVVNLSVELRVKYALGARGCEERLYWRKGIYIYIYIY